MTEKRYDGLQHRRDFDDLCSEGFKAARQAADASGHDSRAFAAEASDQLVYDPLAITGRTKFEHNLKEKKGQDLHARASKVELIEASDGAVEQK